ncbi:MAG TPA: DinB family protein [Vicinamibacterales bacterium]|nr:DinB family protein [Vicinamibacterales bacterium]
MRYMLLTPADQEALLKDLSAMPDLVSDVFAGLSQEEARLGGAEGLSPVEQCWHLADLEREGYGVRIQRLLTEDNPTLADFDGARIARERDYKSLSLADGISAFRRARADNLAALRALSDAAWERRGTQEGVGSIGLCDVPAMMTQHDAAHRGEIEDWVNDYRKR